MAQGYYKQGLHRRKSIFHLFFRKAPFGGDFAVSAGLPLVVDLLEGLRFSADDVQYLGRQKGADGKPRFTESFLNYLQRLRFSGDVYAIPEGEMVYPHEPLLRIEANLLEAQLIETALLTVINFSTLIATKAARIKTAAGPTSRVMEFGLRRAQGIDGGLTASRAAYLGGCDATSNVWAGRYYNIPIAGTHAHSWIMVFPDEITSFEAYAHALPNNCTLLVDTYDTIEGVENAIRIGRQLREKGHELLGIRLDSGDLEALAKAARKLLDEAGFKESRIVASNDLDEYSIQALRESGAPITVWGVGTRLVTAKDQPALGGVYKLAAVQDEQGKWEPRMKLSEQLIKISNPGRLQVRRYYDQQGLPAGSQLYDEFQGEPTRKLITEKGTTPLDDYSEQRDLLQVIFEQGKLVAELEDLPTARERALRQYQRFGQLPRHQYGLSVELHSQKMELSNQLQA